MTAFRGLHWQPSHGWRLPGEQDMMIAGGL